MGKKASHWLVCAGSAVVIALGGAAPQSTGDSANQSAESRNSTTRRGVQVTLAYAELPLVFEPNFGQADPKVKYLSRSRSYDIFLTSQGADLLFRDAAPVPPIAPRLGVADNDGHTDGNPRVLRMRLVGSQPEPEVSGGERLPGQSNYFIGSQPAKWHTNLPHYARVRYAEVYAGIDLVFYGNQRQLEFDFVVAPGADPNAIRLQLEGAERLELDAEMNLLAHLGGVSVFLRAPVIYQEGQGSRTRIEGGYTINDAHEVRVEVGPYDIEQPLVIDPVIAFSTFLGGQGFDTAADMAVDAAGFIYLVGRTNSANFPTANAFQGANNGGGAEGFDAFVTKLSPDGAALIYSTYLGGTTGDDQGFGIAVDGSGSVYVTGSAHSSDFPVTPGAYQTVFAGGLGDAFVSKLSPAGDALVYSTFLGGSNGDDGGFGVAVDATGNTIVFGGTSSTNFPTVGALQPNYGGGQSDVFVAKLDTAGANLLYSTYLGGSGIEFPGGANASLTLDGAGNAYIVGSTGSADFPTMNPFQPAFAGGTGFFAVGPTDGFVAKIDPTGAELIFSTYLGGSGDDQAGRVSLDSAGNIYIAGATGSANFPTLNAFQPAYGGGAFDGFVTKLIPDGSGIVYSTYLGGTGYDAVAGMSDSAGRVKVAGFTNSPNIPLVNPLQATYGGGRFDLYLAELDPLGGGLTFATYLGGNDDEHGAVIAVDTSGTLYAAGITHSLNFPTVNPLQANIGGGFDAFVLKLVFNRPPEADAGADQNIHCTSAGGTSVTLDGSGSSDPDGDALRYVWRDAMGNVVGTTAQVMVTLPLGSHTFTLTVDDGQGGSDSDTVKIAIVVRVEGLLSPLASLVEEGSPLIYPDKAFKPGRTLPLRLRMFCGTTALTDFDVSPPRIVGLARNGDALDLATMDLDAGQSNDSGTLFRYSDGNWVFNLSTAGLGAGTYVVTIQMPDGRRYQAGFVLR